MSLQAPDFLAGRVVSVLKGLGLNDNQVKEAQLYLEGTIPETAFFNKLPKVDMEQLNHRVKETMGKAYQGLRENDADYTARYLNLLFVMGEKSLLKCLYQYMGYSPDKVIKELTALKAPLPYAVAWVAENSVQYSVNPSYIRYLEQFYTENEGNLVEGWKLCDINAKIIIGAFLVAKGPRAYQEFKKWLDEVLLNSVKVLFHDSERFSNEIESISKYLKGGLFVRESLLEEIKHRTAKAMINPYIVHLLTYTGYTVRDVSQVGKRMLKLLLAIEHREVFNFLAGEGYQGTQGIDEERLKGIREAVLDSGVPTEQFIAWLGDQAVGRQAYQTYYPQESPKGALWRSCLDREFTADAQTFQRAIAISDSRTAIYLCKFLWEKGIGQEYVTDAEEAYLDLVEKMLEDCNLHQTLIKECLACLRGEKDFATIQAGLKQVGPDYRLNQLKDCIWFKGVSPLFLRTLSFFCYAGYYGMLGTTIYREFVRDKDKDLADFVALLKEAGIRQDAVLGFILHWATTPVWDAESKKLYQSAQQMIDQMLDADPAGVLPNISACAAEGRAYLLEKLFELNKENYAPLLIEYMDDSAKAVREKVISLLGSYPPAVELILPCLTAKKQAVRECAVHILSMSQDERAKEALGNALESEKSEKVRGVLKNILKVPVKAEGEENTDINIVDYCTRELKKNRGGSINWLNLETLPPVRYAEGEETADEGIVKYILISWATAPLHFANLYKVSAKAEVEKVARYLNRQDLADLVFQVLNRWLEGGAEAKKKWVLPLAASLGDERVINLFKKKIEDWPQNARGAIACDAVRALALCGQDMAIMTIDSVARKFKFKQVKESAAAVMENLAQELNIDPEELSDRIVPNLGFDQRGEQSLDFGPRIFTIRLSQALEVEVYDAAGKKYKSLPAPGKGDDEVKAKQAGDFFKSIKKQVKAVTGIQAVRLEGALATQRKWSGEMWQRVFVQNPIMQQFASGLIWGAYQESGLVQTFRYMEDGSFNTLEEEEYIIPEQALIGLVHPIEITEDEINGWKQQLEDYEIVQPFPQLSRPVFRVSEEEHQAKYVERYGGITINCLSLMGKLTKYGWYRGSVVDGGCYYTFYKEDKPTGLGVELGFSGVGIGGEDEEITVFALKFYKSGTVERGSYVYDGVTDAKLIVPREVPRNFYSEILYEVDRSTTAKLGVNPQWRKDARLD